MGFQICTFLYVYSNSHISVFIIIFNSAQFCMHDLHISVCIFNMWYTGAVQDVVINTNTALGGPAIRMTNNPAEEKGHTADREGEYKYDTKKHQRIMLYIWIEPRMVNFFPCVDICVYIYIFLYVDMCIHTNIRVRAYT